jgi:uncharacterized protein YlzI (FlbEa/FlbD family)
MVNCDHIVHGWTSTTRQVEHTTIKMTNGDSFSVLENLDELIRFSAQ